ncbi:DMT family transporter [Candidatus Woesearchaeota archaeon]|nr:DMT family transporter [Candidatus Woesearchaeota archaeon]
MALTQGILLGLLAMAGWGFADFFAKLLVPKIGVRRTVFWELSILSFIVLPFLLYSGVPEVTPGSLLIFLIVLITQLSGLLLFYKGLDVGKVSIVSPISSAYPLIAVFAGIFLLGEALSTLHSVGIILIILGTVLVSAKISELVKLKKSSLSAGASYGLLAMFSWGIMMVALKYLVELWGIFLPTFSFAVSSALMILLYSGSFGKGLSFSRKYAYLLLLLTAFDALGFLSFNAGLLSGLLSIVAPVSASFPFVTVTLAAFFLRERLAGIQYAGIAGILTGLVLLSLNI